MIDKSSRISNYDISKVNARKFFLESDKSLIRRHIPDLREDLEYYYVPFIGELYRVSKHTGETEVLDSGLKDTDKTDTWLECSFNEIMTIYDILCHSDEPLLLSDQFATLQALNRIQAGSTKTLGDTFFNSFLDSCSASPESLRKALEALNGSLCAKGDISYKVPVAYGINLIIEFWAADEDFPAQINYLFNRNILDFMHYETLWYLISHLNTRLLKLMNTQMNTPH